jgi:hypothetical protein
MNTDNNPSVADRVVTFKVNDGYDDSEATDKSTRTVLVTRVNGVPVVNGISSPIAYEEGSAPLQVAAGSSVELTDDNNEDDNALTNATVTITPFEDGDLLQLAGSFGDITTSFSGGVLVLSANRASINDYQAALNSVTYKSTSDNPSIASRTITFQVNDGTHYSVTSYGTECTLTVTRVNSAPVLSGVTGTIAFTESQTDPAAITVADGVVLKDDNNEDDNALTNATVTITPFEDGDLLQLAGSFGDIATSFSGGVLVLSANRASINDYQAALRAVTYKSTSEDPVETNRAITFQANDGTHYSVIGAGTTRTVTVARVNDKPVFTTRLYTFPSNLTYIEDNAGSELAIGIEIADVDSGTLQWAKFVISANYDRDTGSGGDYISIHDTSLAPGISSSWEETTGVYTLTADDSSGATKALFQEYMHKTLFNSTSHYPSEATRTIVLTMKDYEGSTVPLESDAVSLTVAVTESPDHPSITLVAGDWTYTENQHPQVICDTLTIFDRDDDILVNASVRITQGYEAGWSCVGSRVSRGL